ncbi:hypothetical protein P171DRAFT_507584 [Karstenula rhodostoma CBS 690.94]|uniref:Ubiquitin-like protease family profile domain-containing protein n=1 Tax=Karstenula rhodostoma CBS 690.94 TaxID=1392251 RepID=A0A9P4PRA3_9PLEO|nr:hypothetical protein P171DRAFT_507584 [Karstenula rhodostoma CBS 690.94]
MENAAQPENRVGLEWQPQNTSVYSQRMHALAQTRTRIAHEIDSLYVASSRGFGRELPPMALTRPPLESRRYTVDASLVTGALQYQRDYGVYNYEREPENLTYLTQSGAKIEVSARETDEPFQRQTQLTLPDPLRYRELHRWGCFRPVFDPAKYPGDDGVRRFNNDKYVEFGDFSLSNEDFTTIMDMTGHDAWYRDNVVDAALELCSIYHGAEDNEIMAVSSVTVQTFKGAAISDEESYMFDLKDYLPMFQGKKWIFIPLNDGIGETSAAEYRGNHWSLLVIDRPRKQALYIDGMGRDMEKMAERYAYALRKILGDEEYTFSIQENAPHQWNHNATPHADCGPCGPYIVKMIQIMMAHICKMRNAGLEAEIGFHLTREFSAQFNFDSYAERRALEYNIASFKADKVARERATNHANTVLGLPRPLDQTAFANPTWPTYDAPLFTQNALTFRKLDMYRNLTTYQSQRDTSVFSDSSSGSSGGISINSEASVNDVQMQYQPAPTATNDALLPDWVVPPSPPNYGSPGSDQNHGETVRYDANAQEDIGQYPDVFVEQPTW